MFQETNASRDCWMHCFNVVLDAVDLVPCRKSRKENREYKAPGTQRVTSESSSAQAFEERYELKEASRKKKESCLLKVRRL